MNKEPFVSIRVGKILTRLSEVCFQYYGEAVDMRNGFTNADDKKGQTGPWASIQR